MNYTEYAVNMQKYFLNDNTFNSDAVREHQKEATLPQLKSLYHKMSGINLENKC